MKVDRHIPVPAEKGKYGFNLMQIGDSIFCRDATHHSKEIDAAKKYARRHGIKFTIRKVDGGIRIWRIE